MKPNKTLNICLFLIVSLMLAVTTTVFARGQEEIIQSMKTRVGTINGLKASGVIGETNNGYLAFVGSANGQEAVVAAENQDRKELYAIVAQKQNTSVEVVEKNMGVVKAQRAKPGEFYQNANGAWQKK